MKCNPIIVVALVCGFAAVASSAIMHHSLGNSDPGISSNTVVDIAFDGVGIWLGSGAGPCYSGDGGANWQTFGSASGLPGEQVSALVANFYQGVSRVWVAMSHTEYVQRNAYPFGDGLVWTTDHGQTWHRANMPDSQALWYGKICYDLDLYGSHVYGACFYGGLIRSTDNGSSWENLYLNATDSLDFYNKNYLSYSNRYFSVKIDTTLAPETVSVWAGSAMGIVRYIFAGYEDPPGKQDTALQIYYNPQDTTIPSTQQLPGNFVVALGVNTRSGTTYIWAACRPGGGAAGQRYAVAYSTDYGRGWTTALEDAKGWDFAFNGDTVFVATDDGLAVGLRDSASGDYVDWQAIREAVDLSGWKRYCAAPFYCAELVADTLWAGGADGVVRRVSGQAGWQVYRSQLYPDDHYAYPSPFSPYSSIRKGSTIHYKLPHEARVSVKIYDFDLDLVRVLVDDQPRPGGVEFDIDIWDGRNGQGRIVANGVYFYNISLSTGESWWGKVVVIK